MGGTVHEIGIAFSEKVNVREYMQLDHLSEAFSLERVDPTTLRGTLAVLDPQKLDRKLIQKLLNETNLKIRFAPALDDETREMIAREADMILCEFHLGESSGLDAVEELRNFGVLVPIVMMTSDDSAQTRDKMRSAAVNGFLQKPLTRDRLLRGLAEFLLATGNAGPLYTTLSNTDAAFSLIEQFVDEMPGVISELQSAIDEESRDRCRMICFRLMGSAPSMGFPGIGRLAGAAVTSMESATNMTESVPALKRLIAECRRVRVKKAA